MSGKIHQKNKKLRNHKIIKSNRETNDQRHEYQNRIKLVNKKYIKNQNIRFYFH